MTDTPVDKLVWDTGHQAYIHKILTGRNDRFPLRLVLGCHALDAQARVLYVGKARNLKARVSNYSRPSPQHTGRITRMIRDTASMMFLTTRTETEALLLEQNLIKQLKPLGSVAICGLVASPAFSTTVLPFILRGVNVLGVDSVEIPLDYKDRI